LNPGLRTTELVRWHRQEKVDSVRRAGDNRKPEIGSKNTGPLWEGEKSGPSAKPEQGGWVKKNTSGEKRNKFTGHQKRERI